MSELDHHMPALFTITGLLRAQFMDYLEGVGVSADDGVELANTLAEIAGNELIAVASEREDAA